MGKSMSPSVFKKLTKVFTVDLFPGATIETRPEGTKVVASSSP
jgi:hypothetical protein